MTGSASTDLNDALGIFNAEAEKIITAFFGTLCAQKVPEIIYHYTDDIGLKGILESGRIWLTDIFNLNDPSELRHGFQQALKIWKSTGFYGWAESVGIATFFNFLSKNAELRKAAHFFTCSFSANGDDLGQWRAYADNGRGYALGFDRVKLELAFFQKDDPSPLPDQSVQTFPVQYDDDQLTDLQASIVEKALPLTRLLSASNLSVDLVERVKRWLVVSLASHTFHASSFFKHKAYSNEQEYRFLEMFTIKVTPPDVKVRMRPYSVVRYREFDWRAGASGALKEIVAGPYVPRRRSRSNAIPNPIPSVIRRAEPAVTSENLGLLQGGNRSRAQGVRRCT